jgi:hypothetical protein
MMRDQGAGDLLENVLDGVKVNNADEHALREELRGQPVPPRLASCHQSRPVK